jgi:phosphoglycerate dehydrogenase-like enzyme
MAAVARDVPARSGTREVLVTWPDYDLQAVGIGQVLREAGLEIRLAPKLGSRSAAQVRELVADAAAAIVSTDPFDAQVIASSPDLRVIARVGIGVDSIDLAAATRHGVAVTVTPGANEATVADHTLALMLALLRRICEHDAAVRRGEWNRTGRHIPWTLTGSTVGLVGYGHIGRLVADRLSGFGVTVLASDPVAPADDRVGMKSLDELLASSDIVSLHVPLVPSTRGLIGAAELRLMPGHAVLINTSRGEIVDEKALAQELTAGRLRGAALDVFEDEPPRGSALLSLPNVVLSPHNAGLSAESVDHMLRRATRSVVDVLSGRLPADVANPGVLHHPVFAGILPAAARDPRYDQPDGAA